MFSGDAVSGLGPSRVAARKEGLSDDVMSVSRECANCVLLFSSTVYGKGNFRPSSDFRIIGCELTEPVKRAGGGQSFATAEVFCMEGSLVQQTTQDLAPSLLKLLHHSLAQPCDSV